MKIKQGLMKRNELELNTVEIELEGTTLLLLEGYGAFFMCGALDVEIKIVRFFVVRQLKLKL